MNQYEQLSLSNHAQLKLINYNVRSFRANAQNFLDAFNSCLPQVLVLTETWFTKNYTSDIEGYDSFHTVRPSRRSGSVSIFIDFAFENKQIEQLSYISDNIEVCTVWSKTQQDEFFIFIIFIFT